MTLLILSHALHVGIERVGKPSIQEILVGEVFETLRIESGFEVLESQGIVQYLS